MRASLAVMALIASACTASSTAAPSAAITPFAIPSASSATPSPAATRSPTAAPSIDPRPRVTREIAGMAFVIADAPADVRVDPAISREDEGAIGATIAADIPAVEREFARAFPRPPVIYVFGTTESYAEGFVRIFGYPSGTAAFVAENSVSFFEPSSRLIAVNWGAVGVRRPVAAIRHELTHLLTLDACAPRCDLVPAWLNEGQARLAEARVPGSDWRQLRLRYESAAMAETGTLIPLNALVSQLAWNSLVDWAGYFKYQEAARAVELLRDDIGGDTPIAALYDRLRRGANLAQAYATLTGRSFDDFVTGLPARMRAAAPEGAGMAAVAPESYLLYGLAPGSTVTLTVSGPRGSETWPVVISPFGSSFDGIPPSRARGGYTVTAQTERGVFSVRLRKAEAGESGDRR
jgi:hypothetical protein